MKKTAKTLICLILSQLMILSFCGCSGYSSSEYRSSYKAVGFVQSNKSDSCFMSYYSFEGRMVFKLKSEGEGNISYKGFNATGNLTVYYDFDGNKTELFRLGPDESAESSGGYVGRGTVYIIVETDGKCTNGDLDFSLVKEEK